MPLSRPIHAPMPASPPCTGDPPVVTLLTTAPSGPGRLCHRVVQRAEDLVSEVAVSLDPATRSDCSHALSAEGERVERQGVDDDGGVGPFGGTAAERETAGL